MSLSSEETARHLLHQAYMFNAIANHIAEQHYEDCNAEDLHDLCIRLASTCAVLKWNMSQMVMSLDGIASFDFFDASQNVPGATATAREKIDPEDAKLFEHPPFELDFFNKDLD